MTDAAWLAEALRAVGADAGTVHRVRGDVLVLTAAIGIPPAVQRVTAQIPPGKGMAGLAWTRAAPVETCDLQNDESGDVRPGAKAVDAKEAVAVPVFADDGEVRAVVGFAYLGARSVDVEPIARALPAG